MKKGFALPLILAIILFCVIAVGIGYFRIKSKPVSQPQPTTSSQSISTPSPVIKSNIPTDETANWKSYNYENVVKFKYPSNWIVSECQKDNGKIFITPNDPKHDICVSDLGYTITLTYQNVDNFQVASDFFKPHKLSEENILIRGKKTIKAYGISQLDSEYWKFKGAKMFGYIIDLTDKAVIFSYIQWAASPDYSSEFEKIASSFSFE